MPASPLTRALRIRLALITATSWILIPADPVTAQGAPAAKTSAHQLTVAPSSGTLCAGKSMTFTASRKDVTGSVSANWSQSPQAGGAFNNAGAAAYKVANSASVTFDASSPQGSVASYGAVVLTVGAAPDAGATASSKDSASVTLSLVGTCDTPFGGELTRASIGFEQIGAAGVDNSQKYAFDFFISRPVPIPWIRTAWLMDTTDVANHYFGPRVRWWGDVRIGSYPQQVNSDLVTFGTGFAAGVGKIATNKLVQTAEFTTGPEFRLASFPMPRRAATELSQQRFALTLTFGLGAVGPFSPPDVAVFTVPAASSDTTLTAQYNAFHAAYGNVHSKYIAFRQETPNKFLEHHTVGLRLYTFYAEQTGTAQPLSKAPAYVEVEFGKNEMIAPKGNAWHAAAYYPFALGDRSDPKTIILYFFGDTWMSVGQPAFKATAFELAPAVENGTAVPLTDPRVTIIPISPEQANSRDTYRIGVSVDLLRIWDRLTQPAGK